MVYERLFARFYEAFLSGSERAGLAGMRAALLAEAQGEVVEIGAGTGLNLPHYTDRVSELVLTEPSGPMAARLRDRLAKEPPPVPVRVVEAGAEALPFDDTSFDTVVGTLVLCTVPDPEGALAEVARVLRPGGRFLYLEHVRSPDSAGLAGWQDRLETPWRWFGAGCHCNRDTAATIEASPLETERLERDSMPKAPPLVRPLIRGAAVAPDRG